MTVLGSEYPGPTGWESRQFYHLTQQEWANKKINKPPTGPCVTLGFEPHVRLIAKNQSQLWYLTSFICSSV